MRLSELQELKERYACPCDESASFETFILPRHANGIWVWVEDDEEPYLDLVMGYSSINFGHSHPAIVAAVKNAADGIEQIHSFHTEAKLKLSQLLVETLSPQGEYKVYFDVGGSSVVSAALRLCRAYQNRSAIISFDGGFHGTGTNAAGVTDDRLISRAQYGPNTAFGDITRLPYPDSFRGISEEECLAALEREIENRLPAAVIIEPIQGANGFIIPTPDFLRQVRKIATANNVFLIDDEIQVGLGRVGYFYAIERSGVKPDVLLLSKSLAGGYYPLSALIARSELFTSVPKIGTAFQSTFNNNPFGTNIALSVLRYALSEGVIEKVQAKGQELLERLSFVSEVDHLDNLHGLGLAIAFEFVEDKNTRSPSPALAQAFVDIALKQHVMLYRCGVNRNVIKIAPPLTMADQEIEVIAERIRRCVDSFQDFLNKGRNPI